MENLNKILLSYAESMYKQAIRKFPDCGALKIQFAIFLLEMMEK